jgi:phosphate transport system substrate-binding protein
MHSTALKQANRLGRTGRVAGLSAVALAASLLLGACGSSTTATTTTSSGSSSVSLQETGSTLLYPLFGQWAVAYHKLYPSVSITTAGTGSGTGISDAETGTVDIGTSDAYLPPATFTSNPDIENVPLAISSQQVNYNLPTIPASTHLKLTGKILAQMYTGKITKWNDPAIAAVNPGVTLPDIAVVPIHRSDGSGDTFLFTSFLSKSDPTDWTLGYDTTISWPHVTGAIGALKNSGMLSACKGNPGCVAYIGISYLQKTEAAGLGEAELQNSSGSFLLPSPTTIDAEAGAFPTLPANGAQSLIWGSAAGGYPIINFEYAIVLTDQSSSTKAAAIKALLSWIISPTGGSGASFLTPVNFNPLPAGAVSVATSLISKIT